MRDKDFSNTVFEEIKILIQILIAINLSENQTLRAL